MMPGLGSLTSTAPQPFARESAIRGMIEAAQTEGRNLDRFRQDFPRLWTAVMALVGIDMMRE